MWRTALGILAVLAATAVGTGQASFSYSPTPVYSGGPITFTDTSVFSANVFGRIWTIDGDSTPSPLSTTIVHTFDSPGQKTATIAVFVTGMPSQHATQTINVLQGPLAVVSASATVGCAPFTTTLNGTASTTPFPSIIQYLWTFSDGTTATGAVTTHMFPSAGSHWADLEITDAAGYKNKKRTNITVGGSSAHLEVIGPATVCAGSTGQIGLTLLGAPPYVVTWSDGLVETVAVDGTHVRSLSLNQAGQPSFGVSVADGSGCSSLVSGAAQFSVLAAPTATLELLTNPVCENVPFQIRATIVGQTWPYSIVWTDGVVSAPSFPFNVVTRTFTRAAGSYTFGLSLVSDAFCTAPSSTSIAVTVAPQPTATVVGGEHLSFGEVGEVAVHLLGTPPFSLTWSDGLSQTVSGSPAKRLVIPAANTAYTLAAATDASGCTMTINASTANFTVDPAVPLDGHAWTIDAAWNLRRVRLSDGQTLAMQPMTISGYSPAIVRSLVRRPASSEYFALFTAPGTSALASVDLLTGIATIVAVYAQSFRGIAFDDLGRLLAVTLAAGTSPGTIQELDPITGAATPIGTHTISTQNVRIAFNRNAHALSFLGGGADPSAKLFTSFESVGFTPTANGFASRSGEFSGTILGFAPINGYGFVATIGADLYLLFGESRGIVKAETLDHLPSVIACEADAFMHLSGTGEDLSFLASRNGVFGIEGRKYLAAGDTLGLVYVSPGGTLGGQTALLILDLYATGQDPYFTSPLGLSPVHVGASSALVVAAEVFPGSDPIVGNYPVPFGLAGLTSRLQVICPNPAAENGFLAASEAYDFVFVP